MSYYDTKIDEIIDLKKRRGNIFEGDTDEVLRAHLAQFVDHIEFIEGADNKVVAYMEWYDGRPEYENGKLKRLQPDETCLYVANVVAESLSQILQMGRQVLRFKPMVLWIHGSDVRYKQNMIYKVNPLWRAANGRQRTRSR